jgi:hypothetical protein
MTMNRRKICGLIALFVAVIGVAPSWAGSMPAEEAGSESRLSIHGYGELHYNQPSDGVALIDAHRMVWGMSYVFSDTVSLHTEIDFEHAARDMELEFAYVDFLITPALNIRAGTMLMPVGPLNEFHEPTLFYSVERPRVQTSIIPTTWQEGGFGIFGSTGERLKYRLYLVSSLDASKFSDTGIRSSRGKVNNAPSDDFAVVGRAEYAAFSGLDLGLSIYNGGANTTANPGLGDAGVEMTEADVRFQKMGLDIRGVYVTTTINAADKISTVTKKTVGKKMGGMYVEVAYRVGSVVPFVRVEQYNTQKEVATGSADPKNDKDVMTYGLAYYPDPNVAIKIDQENHEDGNGKKTDIVNAGVAGMF